MSDRDVEQPDRFCQECGQRLDPAVQFCTHCGVDLASSPQSEDDVSHSHRSYSRSPRGRSGVDERGLIEKFVLGVGVVFGMMVLLSIVIGFIAPVIFELGGEALEGPILNTDKEQTVENYYEAIAKGNETRAESKLHSDGPAAENAANESYGGWLWRSYADVQVLDSSVVEEGDQRVVLDVEVLIDDSQQEESQILTGQIELRREDGNWRIWSFPI